MKDITIMVQDKVKVSTDMLMETSMMGNGLQIINMELVSKFIKILVNTMVIGKMERDMEKVSLLTKMVMFIQDGGNMVKKKDLELIHSNQLE
jgi:hypothetical protein